MSTKSLLFIPIFLTLLSLNVIADEVVVTQYLSGADVTIQALNNNQNAIVNTLNGNVEGGINIKAGSINTVDLAQAVSPVTRWSDSFNDYTVSGMLPVTDSDLTSDISAGVSYVNGFRLQLSATSKTYTASKDTFVYINEGGYYAFCEEPNGASSCGSVPANSLLLAEVVTSGTAITAVNDLRTLSIQITTTTTNFPANYRDSATVSRDSATAMHVEVGGIAIGNTIYSRTTDTSTKTLTTGTNWIEGGYSPGSPRHIFIYAYNDAGSTFDFKYSSADPVYSDTSNNTGGVLRYYTTGGVYYRAIGWAWVSADQITAHEFGNFKDVGISNTVVRTSLTSALVNDTSYGVDLTETEANFYTTGGSVVVQGTINYDDGSANPIASATVRDNSINCSFCEVSVEETSPDDFFLAPQYQAIDPQGSRRISFVAKVGSGSVTSNKRQIRIQEI